MHGRGNEEILHIPFLQVAHRNNACHLCACPPSHSSFCRDISSNQLTGIPPDNFVSYSMSFFQYCTYNIADNYFYGYNSSDPIFSGAAVGTFQGTLTGTTTMTRSSRRSGSTFQLTGKGTQKNTKQVPQPHLQMGPRLFGAPSGVLGGDVSGPLAAAHRLMQSLISKQRAFQAQLMGLETSQDQTSPPGAASLSSALPLSVSSSFLASTTASISSLSNTATSFKGPKFSTFLFNTCISSMFGGFALATFPFYAPSSLGSNRRNCLGRRTSPK